jgi:ATP-dependent DNA helicase RecG
MNKAELIAKLKDIEWEDFEVKEAAQGLPKNIWETVSAFSNTAGGWIVLGVGQSKDNYDVTGVKAPEKLESEFLTVLRGEKFNSKLLVSSKKYKIDGRTVLAFYVPLSDKKPVYFNSRKNTFIRTGSGDQRATDEEIDAMYRDAAFGTHSAVPVDGSSEKWLNMLSVERYRDYISRFNPGHSYNNLMTEEFLIKTRVLSKGKTTYSGLLVFGKNDFIQQICPDFRIDLLEIPGTSYSDTEQRYTFRLEEQENIWEYYFALFNRIQQKLDLPFQKINIEGFAVGDYPHLDALREALVNFLMHADYFSTLKPRIRIFIDRIEFLNPGALPKPLKMIMQEDISMPRNPVIAKIFRIAKLAENAGYGFDKMVAGWKPYAKTAPEFEQGLDFTKSIFRLPEKIGKTVGKSSGIDSVITMGDKWGEKWGDKWGDKWGEVATAKRFKIVLAMIRNPRISTTELAKKLGMGNTGVEKHLKALRESGCIRRVGPAKGGHWEILEETFKK